MITMRSIIEFMWQNVMEAAVQSYEKYLALTCPRLNYFKKHHQSFCKRKYRYHIYC